MNDYDEDYYQRGFQSGKSLYENYRFMPYLSYEIANKLKEMFPGQSILDFGCAMGYTVWALQMMDVVACGYDISEYCKKNARIRIIDSLDESDFDIIYAKDVFEHVNDIHGTLEFLREHCRTLFAIIPLGDNGKYRIPEYHLDKTHFWAEDEEWWVHTFKETGFSIKSFHHSIKPFKRNWIKQNRIGNGFFILE